MLRFCSLCIVLLGLFPISTLATSFVLASIDDQISQSDGIIRGTFQGESYKKNPYGEVVTEAYFKVTEQIGIANNRLLNPHFFRVLIPGGRWQGIVYDIRGTPKFKKGEKVVLLLKHHSFGFSLTNLSMSKFRIENRDGVNYLISDVFPNRPNVGIIEWKNFENAVKRNFGSGLIPSTGRKFVIDKKVENRGRFYKKGHKAIDLHLNKQKDVILYGRKFASVPKKDQDNGILWFIIILGALGGASVGLARYKRN